jgi:hypothetical protein
VNNNEYAFLSRWRVEGTCGEVADILGDPLAMARWWPSVYLSVDELRPPDVRGLGQRVRFHEVVESGYPFGFTLVAIGDFDGRGVWTFRQDGAAVEITYDWRLRAEKPLLRHLSFLMKPLFEANHRWAMTQGEESLKLELARRRATSDAALAKVPPPPGPVTYAAVGLLAAGAAVGGTVAYLMLRARRRKDRLISRAATSATRARAPSRN